MDPKSSEHESNNSYVLFLNILSLAGTYIVIALFCIKQVSGQSGEHSLEMWLNAIVNAVCISTFTYNFTQTINNLALDRKRRTLRLNAGMLVAGVVYILLYSLWGATVFWLNVFLCVYTIFLVILPSWSLHRVIKTQESGQDSGHTMKTDDVALQNVGPQCGYLPE